MGVMGEEDGNGRKKMNRSYGRRRWERGKEIE